jgi:hypothetical protein
MAPELFETCKLRIESRIRRQAFARFFNVTAKRDGDSIAVSGRVTVTSEWILNPRLRIALVEDGIRYSGANRIPYHNFVLRKFLGPAEGIVLQKESNNILESASIRGISDELRQHAILYEKERSDFMGAEFRFSGDANTINPEQISVVLFVQDARTTEVLQALVRKPEPASRKQEEAVLDGLAASRSSR